MNRSHSLRAGAVSLLCTAGLALSTIPSASGADAHGAPPSPGAAGIGDRLYPTLGNGGYDALHYDLSLRYATSAPDQGIDGTMTMRARAKKSLSRFDLDFNGKSVGSVAVNGRRATFTRSGEELVITPARPIRRHMRFVVKVRHFTADPVVPDPDVFLGAAFFVTPDGSATAGQPDAMHDVYPSNDHPRDKATFSFRFDVPKGTTAVANGVRTGRRRTHGGRTIWTYRQRQPMATELTQLAVGDFTVIRRRSVDGVRVRDVVPTRLVSQFKDTLGVERGQLRYLRKRVGAYPFDTYGSLIVDTSLGFALETQTLSLYDTPWFEFPRSVWDPVMAHELAHQWFGDSVSPWEWSDVWLNEGHASWYEFTYAEDRGMLEDHAGFPTLDGLMKAVYSAGDIYRDEFGPVARPLSGDVEDVFNPNVYEGGALVLYALRQQVGTADFRRIERAWVHRYEGRSASTRDFVRLASRVSGQDLRDFLGAWLYGTSTPPMPGHPDWTVLPVDDAAAGQSARKVARKVAGSLVGLATEPKR